MLSRSSRGSSTGFDLHCTRCARLVNYLRATKQAHPKYHCRPVSGFGAGKPRLLVVGLAPGLHGANATGRPFTGDAAGQLLYASLHKFGFANQPISTGRSDQLRLSACRITNAVKCVPPQNKPSALEVRTCNPYLKAEIAAVRIPGVVLALGRIAHEAVLLASGRRHTDFPFRHGTWHELGDGLSLCDSYHTSQYNIHTKRLTAKMFHDVVAAVRQRLDKGHAGR